MKDSFLTQALVYLVASLVSVPLAKRFGLGAVLGYLLAGIAIGPTGLHLVGHEGHDVMHFAEFGVVMMLFLVGLELRPTLLWSMRKSILGLGGLQVLGTLAAVCGIAIAFGLETRVALALGMIAAMSSTAIVLSSLEERKLTGTEGGRAAFAVLLFQDISVIPILAVFPLLRPKGTLAGLEGPGAGRPGWQQALLVLVAVAVVVLVARYVLRFVFRFLADTHLREVFTVAALALVIGIAQLMESVGLSAALGTFLAGVVLAESQYRHQLEADIEPFKGILLGVFFIAVGASIDFPLLLRMPVLLIGSALALLAIKGTVLYVLGRSFHLGRPARWVFAFSLAQGGEFAFVLVSFGVQSQVLPQEVANSIVLVVALSMLLTPFMFVALERLVLPRLQTVEAERQPDEIHDRHDVIMAGYGRVGQIVARILRASGFQITVLDIDAELLDFVQRMGVKVHYGDASRPDLLAAAGCAKAKLFVLAIDDAEKTLQIAEAVREHYPRLKLLVRVKDRVELYKLRQAGVEHVFRETYGSAVEIGEQALRALGYRAHRAHRAVSFWRRNEETATEKLREAWVEGTDTYIAAARTALEQQETIMRREAQGVDADAGWNNESLRADVLRHSVPDID